MQDMGKIEAALRADNGRLARAPPFGQDSVFIRENVMAGSIEHKLASLGISLPTPAAPIANYVPFVKSGNMLVVSGQLCFGADGKLIAKGQLGGGVSIEDGQKAARACAINLLAQIK